MDDICILVPTAVGVDDVLPFFCTFNYINYFKPVSCCLFSGFDLTGSA